MSKTRKVQVTLDETQYEQLAEIARRQNRKLAAVVRESVVRYCLEPEAERRKRRALDTLLAVDPVPVPDEYGEWEAAYGDRKATGGQGDSGAGDTDRDVADLDRGTEA